MLISDLLNIDPEVEFLTDKKSMIDGMNIFNLMVDKRLRVDIATMREINENNGSMFQMD